VSSRLDSSTRPRRHFALSVKLTLGCFGFSAALATDSPDFHQGRTRAVPHAKGQWAAHIYLERASNLLIQLPASRLECSRELLGT